MQKFEKNVFFVLSFFCVHLGPVYMIPHGGDGMFSSRRKTRLGMMACLYGDNFKNRLVVLVCAHHVLL